MPVESNYSTWIVFGEGFDVEEPINVTINDTEYTLPFNEKVNGFCHYGAPYIDDNNYDFSEYPVEITSEIGSADYGVAVNYSLDMETPFTISASYMKKTEAEWAKVGANASGGKTPLFEATLEFTQEDGQTWSLETTVPVDFAEMPAEITVVWDDVEYSNLTANNNNEWGASFVDEFQEYDYSEYPFNIYFNGNVNTKMNNSGADLSFSCPPFNEDGGDEKSVKAGETKAEPETFTVTHTVKIYEV